jgi:hypothetical protein
MSAAPARSWPHPQRPRGNRSTRRFGLSVHARFAPGAPGCLPRLRFGPPRRFGFAGGGALPTSSSLDGGIEEFAEFLDSRCSNSANLAARSLFVAVNSATCFACSPSSASLTSSNWQSCEAIEEIWMF